ncbi:LiaF transmembrane domain-containing protein [Marivirga sp.]|uniref:LiaF transmembrane domain-containing protein n=1 Tax=Marivirga sp. TaxID=2018662 RepID=UPI003DA782A4
MENKQKHKGNNNMSFGVLLLIIGGILLLDRMDIIEFSWIFSWPFILIGVGIYSLVRHGLRNSFGIIMLLVGSFFLIRRENLIPTEYYDLLLPGGIILIGLYLILSRTSKFGFSKVDAETGFDENLGVSDAKTVESDYIRAEAVFASVQRRLITKNFKGGKITTAFGGADIDLSKAEIQDSAVLDVEVTFGGLKLIIPPHWEVQADVSNVFSGIEDKRAFPSVDEADRKILYIKGSVNFGGLEFKSY